MTPDTLNDIRAAARINDRAFRCERIDALVEAAKAREEADSETLQEMGIRPAEVLYPSISPLEYKAIRKRVLREAIGRALAASGPVEEKP